MHNESLVLAGTDGDRVTVSPTDGGRISSIVAGGRELLRSREAPDVTRPIDYGCFLMAPWVGRLDHGRLPTPDGELSVPPSGGEDPHAIHGVTWDRAWDVVDVTEQRAVLAIDLGGVGNEWPLGGRVTHEITVEPLGLEMIAVVEAGDRPMPAAVGWHPWFLAGHHAQTFIEMTAEQTLVMREDLVPTGERTAIDAATELGRQTPIGKRLLDHTYVGTGPGAAITTPRGRLELTWSANTAGVTVHSPEGAVCVEPLTAWPNAPVLAARGTLGTGLVTLDAGAQLRASFRIAWSL